MLLHHDEVVHFGGFRLNRVYEGETSCGEKIEIYASGDYKQIDTQIESSDRLTFSCKINSFLCNLCHLVVLSLILYYIYTSNE
jgi:hypothetical protein